MKRVTCHLITGGAEGIRTLDLLNAILNLTFCAV
ncbi:MAG: hypothetical protein XU11_C0022G0048, partial [Candidatus Dadabacteria bacterium CSP1-2]